MPVLSWWAVVSTITKASTTLTMLAILILGLVLFAQGKTTIGGIVMFMSFAGMLIQRLEQAARFVNSVFMNVPRLEEFFGVLDTTTSVKDRKNAVMLKNVRGEVSFDGVTFSYDGVSRNPARVVQEKLDIGLCWCDAEELIPPSPPAATPRNSVALDLRYAGERRVSGFSHAFGASWIPACAGMTRDCAPTIPAPAACTKLTPSLVQEDASCRPSVSWGEGCGARGELRNGACDLV
jgi:hypothetical protein